MYKTDKEIIRQILYEKYDPEDPLRTFALYADPHKLMHIKKGESVIFQRDPATYCYFILKGRLAVLNNIDWVKDAILDYVMHPHILGLVESLASFPYYTAYVVADQDCLLYRVEADAFLKILREDNDLCYRTLVIMGQITDDNMNRAETHRVFPPKDILGHYLYIQARGALPYTCPMTRKDLSAELNINLRSLYRYLEYFQSQGRIQLIHGKIVIKENEFKNLEKRYGDIIM